jgi:hypothetical protein
MASFWRRLFGRQTQPPAISAPLVPEPQHLSSEEETFLAQLVQDLADGKRRDEVGTQPVIDKLDGLWKAGHERLAVEWTEKLLTVPEVPADKTAPLRAALVERYDQRGELDTALPHLEQLVNLEPYALRAHYLLAEYARKKNDHDTRARKTITSARCATTKRCSAATSTTRTSACASSASASSRAAPPPSPAKRSQQARSQESKQALAIASCVS